MKYLCAVSTTIGITLLWIGNITAQCTNTLLYPSTIINAPNYQTTVLVTTVQYAGEYFEIMDFNHGKDYTFSTTAVPADYITVRNLSGTVIGHGPSPFTLNNVTNDTFQVHINLLTPPCGSQSSYRTTNVTCLDCPTSNNAGIGTSDPSTSAILELKSNTQGLKIPSMTSASVESIPDPVDGLLVHDNSNSTLAIYNQYENSWDRLTKKKTKRVVIAGLDFHPKSDNGSRENYFTSYWGKFGGTPNSVEFSASLNLPVGSKISKIIYYFRDNNGLYDLKFQLRRIINLSDTDAILSSSSSSLASTAVQSISVDLNHIINSQYSYYINVYTDHPTLGFPSMGIKAIAIDYIEP